MHNWVHHVSHGTALLRVTASHRHYMRPRYLMYVYRVCVSNTVRVRACAPRRAACHAAI